MGELTPTYGLAFKVWWAIFWRMILFALAVGIALGVVIGIMGAMLGVEQDSVSTFAALIGLVNGIMVAIWVLKRMMTKGFGRLRLMVVEK